ncbi:MAG TPA: glutathione peroxidase [Steroidobacteraceae bacterium]|nr:glutathione peroxidase [Steroidobacteraceae bacterium]
MSASLYDTTVNRIDGTATRLDAYRGKVLLIVNVASKCGLTPQYKGLEALYEAKRSRGFEILGFPANDFAGQEPGTDAEIASFCSMNYSVQFPMFSKIAVKGGAQHPLYRKLTASKPQAVGEGPMREKLKGYGMDPGKPGDVLWNFEKFLVDRDGIVVERFTPDIAPDDARLVSAIDRELAK